MDVKEKIGMTILGQMLFEDGEKKGMELGRKTRNTETRCLKAWESDGLRGGDIGWDI
ncbi:MAG: hypothetical protein ACLTDI_13190 [Acutalibacteraceae bacterium]